MFRRYYWKFVYYFVHRLGVKFFADEVGVVDWDAINLADFLDRIFWLRDKPCKSTMVYPGSDQLIYCIIRGKHKKHRGFSNNYPWTWRS